MHSAGLVATKTLWLALVSLPCQRSLVIAPKKAAGTLERQHLSKFFWNLAVEVKLLELWKGKVTKVVMPSHELGLFLGG